MGYEVRVNKLYDSTRFDCEHEMREVQGLYRSHQFANANLSVEYPYTKNNYVDDSSEGRREIANRVNLFSQHDMTKLTLYS